MTIEQPTDISAFFNDDEFALSAVYRPADGGADVSCSVLLDFSYEESNFISQGNSIASRIARVPVQDLAAPKRNDTIIIDGVEYKVLSKPELVSNGVIWQIELSN